MQDVASEAVSISDGGSAIDGDLREPASAIGIVVFAHGSGSSRFSSRNRAVARLLEHAAMATLMLDLLTAQEARDDEWTGEHRFDVVKLGSRVIAAVDWLRARPRSRGLPIGLFGASTGAAAALIAAAARPAEVRAVVSRGGRPDLADDALARVGASTLLIVGGDDREVLQLNQMALAGMTSAAAELSVVAGATHLFEEPGALERVAVLARDWFNRHLIL